MFTIIQEQPLRKLIIHKDRISYKKHLPSQSRQVHNEHILYTYLHKYISNILQVQFQKQQCRIF